MAMAGVDVHDGAVLKLGSDPPILVRGEAADTRHGGPVQHSLRLDGKAVLCGWGGLEALRLAAGLDAGHVGQHVLPATQQAATAPHVGMSAAAGCSHGHISGE